MRSAHPTPSDRNQPQHQENCTLSTSNWDPTTDFNLDNFNIPPTVEFTHEIQPEPQSVFSTDICKQKTASSQTDRSKPPKKLSVKHQHSSTSPVLFKDKAVQEKPIMVSSGTSPHVKMQDCYVIPLDESPLAHSPGTPLMTPRESRNVLFEGLSPIQCITLLNLDRHFWRTVEGLNHLTPSLCGPQKTHSHRPIQIFGTNEDC